MSSQEKDPQVGREGVQGRNSTVLLMYMGSAMHGSCASQSPILTPSSMPTVCPSVSRPRTRYRDSSSTLTHRKHPPSRPQHRLPFLVLARPAVHTSAVGSILPAADHNRAVRLAAATAEAVDSTVTGSGVRCTSRLALEAGEPSFDAGMGRQLHWDRNMRPPRRRHRRVQVWCRLAGGRLERCTGTLRWFVGRKRNVKDSGAGRGSHWRKRFRPWEEVCSRRRLSGSSFYGRRRDDVAG